MTVRLEKLNKALTSLEDSLALKSHSELERDGVIQRFEYTFELTWKAAKQALADQGISCTSPKSVIRELGSQGWLDDVELWLGFLVARNYVSHTYNDETAKWVFSQAVPFARQCRSLLTTLAAKT